jgi:hypothetical protein
MNFRHRLTLILLGILVPSIVLADEPPSDSQRTAIVAAMAKVGCIGGHIEKDDGGFEVDDAICDGVPDFDLDLNASFQVIRKNRDD